VFNATVNTISAIRWRSVLLVREQGVPGENNRPAASHWKFYHILSTPGRLRRIRTHNVNGGISHQECITTLLTPVVTRRVVGSHDRFDLIPTHYVCNLYIYTYNIADVVEWSRAPVHKAKRLVVQCINGVISNPVEGRTKMSYRIQGQIYCLVFTWSKRVQCSFHVPVWHQKSSNLNSSFRYIDDVLSLNNFRFDYYLNLIYPCELKVK
jgi:hypothetical protein